MSTERQTHGSPMFTQLDVTGPPSAPSPVRNEGTASAEQTRLLREILASQDRQNELLEEMVSQMVTAQRQRSQELNQWKAANPSLTRSCRRAADVLSQVQAEFLDQMTTDLNENGDLLAQGDFLLNEFVDRYGPRLAHLNGLLQVLVQLGGPTSAE